LNGSTLISFLPNTFVRIHLISTRLFRPIYLIFFLFVLTSCKTVSPPIPVYEPTRKVYTRAISTVSIPLEIPLKLIENKINAQFKGVIYDDDSYTRPTADNIKIRVYQNSRIGVTAIGNELRFSIPLKIWAQGRYDPCSFCPEVEKQTIFDVEVYLRSKVEVLKNYQFKLSTASDGFEWKSQPLISIGPINIPIGRLLERVIDEQLQSVSKEIDKNMNGAIDLRDQVEALWKVAQVPVLLDDSTKTWLRAEPKALLLAPITSDNTTMNIILGLETYLETFTGKKPDAPLHTPLPDLRMAGRGGQDFSIQIRSELGFDAATALAKAQLVGQVFTFKKKAVRVEDIQVYGKGDLAYVRLVLSGSIRGELFLSGIPKFNSETNEFSIDNLDYDINSRSVLVKTASWLLNGTLQKQLQNQMHFSFDKEVSSIRADLSKRLKSTSYKKLFTVKGSLKVFKVRDIYVADDHFDIVLDANGNAKIVLESADF
jgi:hypothetical protein